ncbi:uncharacterized protein PV07_12419 [Cladophialophora immunda]|uniref:Uncharacterized protein n=1 Tax=Cladophialophora immunda TaxID=569365 RepID=A0A0D1Z4N4_9EURO|nr:uncharacterized protein PV07_12419 [Cladophialophora immunda]KIW22541.1 hypothetical protein PV07_12419 [Cladophialophora immunda]OQV10110.1 hypothetical protein CLAIMM_14154 [Cladophialophora immunda]
MGKKSNRFLSLTTPPPLSRHPWIYVNDPTTNTPHAASLKDMIGECIMSGHIKPDENLSATEESETEKLGYCLDSLKDDATFGAGQNVFLITEHLADSKTTDKLETAKKFREQAIKGGRNFASVNLYLQNGTKEKEQAKWGPNHLELGITNMTVKEVAQSIYQWLFTVLSPTEHVHLIPKAKLQAVDKQNFGDYKYCPIADTKSHPKDAKIQFVVVIVTKPVVVPNTQRLQWTVADKSGMGNFYFQYRGATSQFTWDWVLALKPGDVKALPRMPMVQVKESRRLRIAKFPLRTAGSAISGVGLALKTVGHGVAKLGDIASMGKAAEWVPSGDVAIEKNGKMKKIDWTAKFAQERKDRVAKLEKTERWNCAKLKAAMKKQGPTKEKDSDCVGDSSTLRGSEYENEKAIVSEKEFC